MKRHTGQLRALAATARLPNVPSVVSNVWLGVLLGGSGLLSPLLATGAALCLYVCGGFINDWADRDWDARRRPERALPGGIFAPTSYLIIALVLLGMALNFAAFAGGRALMVAGALASCIGIYTWLHKKSAFSVVFMGLCRGLLPLLGWAAAGASENFSAVLLAVLALFFHVQGLSLVARFETMAQPPAMAMRLAKGLFPLAALAMLAAGHLGLDLPLAHCLPGLLVYGWWIVLCLTRFRHPLPRMVSNLLAAIPLVDWMLLLPLFFSRHAENLPPLAAIACLCLPPLAFLAGKLLQRYAPAT